jgi:hypothetical protein
LAVLFGILFAFFFLSPQGKAHATGRSVQEACENLGKFQKKLFGIQSCTWTVPPAPAVPYARLVGCHSCSGATYDAAGNITNAADLTEIPTSWILNVPESYSGKAVVRVPPGSLDHLFFVPFMETLRNEGYAFGVMNHPSPGNPLFPRDRFGASFRTGDLRDEYLLTGYQLRLLLGVVFRSAHSFYGFGVSRGVLLGMGLITDEPLSPFDGYVLVVGGNGYLNYNASLVQAFKNNAIPLTGIAPIQQTDAAKVGALIGQIRLSDPEYADFILSQATPAEQLALAMAYDPSTRPRAVQKEWANVEFGPRLWRKVIIFHGFRDRTVLMDGTLTFAQHIIEAGRRNLYRLYLIKDMGHAPFDPPAPPEEMQADAVRKLDVWVKAGTPPDESDCAQQDCMDGGQFGPLRNCSVKGFAADPLGCFCETIGGIDFAGKPIPECE